MPLPQPGHWKYITHPSHPYSHTPAPDSVYFPCVAWVTVTRAVGGAPWVGAEGLSGASHSPTGVEGGWPHIFSFLVSIKCTNSSAEHTELLAELQQHTEYKEARSIGISEKEAHAARKGRRRQDQTSQKKLPGQGHLLHWLEVQVQVKFGKTDDFHWQRISTIYPCPSSSCVKTHL